MESIPAENYLKVIYMICVEAASEVAATGELARRLGLSPGTVTGMLQRLEEAKLVKYKSHQGARLTAAGKRLALKIIRRHRLVGLFLAQALGMPWDEVHEEAEQLEHAVSDRLAARIDEYLGFPDRDPHGDPIPDINGDLRTAEGEPLGACATGTRFVLLRVPADSPDFLRYLADGGLRVGATAEVVANQPSAGILTVRSGDQQLSLSQPMAETLLVRRL